MYIDPAIVEPYPKSGLPSRPGDNASHKPMYWQQGNANKSTSQTPDVGLTMSLSVYVTCWWVSFGMLL